MYEINGNLESEYSGIVNFGSLRSVTNSIWTYYIGYFGESLMSSVDLYIDNATKGSGYTPITTPIFGKYITIKLHIDEYSNEGIIAFQFAHELMHFVFFVKYGLDKRMADVREESICTAASLIVLYRLYPQCFSIQNEYVKTLKHEGYRKGAEVAENAGYDFGNLIKLI